MNHFIFLYLDAYQMQIMPQQDGTKQDFIQAFHLSKRKAAQYSIPAQYKAHQLITIYFPWEDSIIVSSSDPISIIYEDEILLVVNKPPFLLVHDDGNGNPSLQDQVNAYLYQCGCPHKAQACHRIDFETSGLVLFCKNPFFQGMLDHLFRSHEMQKTYRCLVKGKFPANIKEANFSIGRHRHENAMIIHPHGKPAHTQFQRIQATPTVSFLHVNLLTGRKHQIRLHCAHLSHPIINDPLYGQIEDDQGLMLQNYQMEFVHPLTQKELVLTLPIESRFDQAWRKRVHIHAAKPTSILDLNKLEKESS